MDKKILITGLAAAVTGGLVGGAVTYLTVKKTFEQRTEKAIQEVKDYYSLVHTATGVTTKGAIIESNDPAAETPLDGLTPEELERAMEVATRMQYGTPSEESAEGFARVRIPNTVVKEAVSDSVTINVFNTSQDIDPGEQVVGTYTKVDGQPYLISHDEYFETEQEYDKLSIVYFAGDDTLADERSKNIDDVERLVGERHLDMFGKKWQSVTRSGNPDILYVRNPNIASDFEIAFDSTKYQVSVLGMAAEDLDDYVPKESVRKMRDSD